MAAQARIPKLQMLTESARAALLDKVTSVLENMESTAATPSVIEQLVQLSEASRGGIRYAALSYSDSERAWGYATNATSQQSAEQTALGNNDAPDARIIKWVRNGYIAFARAENGAVGWAHSNTSADDAEGKAMGQCIKYGGEGIYIELTIHSHQQ